jgi:fanconi anemia group J protein
LPQQRVDVDWLSDQRRSDGWRDRSRSRRFGIELRWAVSEGTHEACAASSHRAQFAVLLFELRQLQAFLLELALALFAPTCISVTHSTRMSGGSVCRINGIDVEFPFAQPYPQQRALMSQALRCVSRGLNGLLELPTGGGKTLALLCATLAWQREAQARFDRGDVAMLVTSSADESIAPTTERADEVLQAPPMTVIEVSSDTSNDDECDSASDARQKSGGSVDSDFASPPRPVARKEAKVLPANSHALEAAVADAAAAAQRRSRTSSVPRIFYAARTHNQLAQVVRELKRTAYKPRMVILAARERYCVNERVKKRAAKAATGLSAQCAAELDSAHGCRFAQQRAQLQRHRSLRPPLGQQAVWDIEDFVELAEEHGACAYFAARDMMRERGMQLILCPYNYIVDPAIRASLGIVVDDDIVILDEAHNIESTCRDAASLTLDASVLHDVQTDLFSVARSAGQAQLKPNETRAFADAIQFVGALATLLLGVELELRGASGSFDGTTKQWTGDAMAAELRDKAAVTLPSLAQAKLALDVVVAHAIAAEPGEPRVSQRASGQLRSLLVVLGNVLGDAWRGAYRVVAERRRRTDAERAALSSKRARSSAAAASSSALERLDTDPHFLVQLHFWCMASAVAFAPLSRARCTLLTSGTLAPLESFASELGVRFAVTLEASHVIDVPRQVFAAALARGPNGGSLKATYQATSSVAYQDELGAVLVDIFAATPRGVLVFVPSYYTLALLTARWQSTGAWQAMQRHKPLHVEPDADAKSRGAEPFDDTLARYRSAAKAPQGAALIGVFRGKVSEGTDFAGDDARAVVVVGIPFPNTSDLRVQLKKDYNDLHREQLGTGHAWYALQAYRALNQALGRGIRNRDDWCALVLLDERHSRAGTSSSLNSVSKWLRAHIGEYGTYAAFHTGLTAFFNRQTAAPPEQQQQRALPEE